MSKKDDGKAALAAARAEEAAQRKAAIQACEKVEREFGRVVARWAMRKHVATAAAKDQARKRIRELQNEIASLERA